MARRRAHRYVDGRDPALEVCAFCGQERRKVLTVRHGEPVWSSALLVLFRPRGRKFWTTEDHPCFQLPEARLPRFGVSEGAR